MQISDKKEVKYSLFTPRKTPYDLLVDSIKQNYNQTYSLPEGETFTDADYELSNKIGVLRKIEQAIVDQKQHLKL